MTLARELKRKLQQEPNKVTLEDLICIITRQPFRHVVIINEHVYEFSEAVRNLAWTRRDPLISGNIVRSLRYDAELQRLIDDWFKANSAAAENRYDDYAIQAIYKTVILRNSPFSLSSLTKNAIVSFHVAYTIWLACFLLFDEGYIDNMPQGIGPGTFILKFLSDIFIPAFNQIVPMFNLSASLRRELNLARTTVDIPINNEIEHMDWEQRVEFSYPWEALSCAFRYPIILSILLLPFGEDKSSLKIDPLILFVSMLIGHLDRYLRMNSQNRQGFFSHAARIAKDTARQVKDTAVKAIEYVAAPTLG